MEEPLLDFQKVCRVCLQEGETTSVFLEDISKKIMECTSVQVGQNDGLPGQICDKCSANLLISYQFKKLCEGSDIKLRRQLIKSESTSNKHVPENKTECINLDCDPFIKLYRGDNINPFVQLSEQPPLTTVNCKVEPEMEVVTDTENLERITVHCKVEPEMEVVTGIEDLEQTTVGCKVETKMEVVTGIEDLGQVQDGYDVEMNLKEQQQEDVVGLPYQWPPEQTVSVQQGVVEDELKSVDLDDEDMAVHIKSHNVDFKCYKCDKRFSSIADLNIHRLTHTDKRAVSTSPKLQLRRDEWMKHKCYLCLKDFNSGLDLRAHMESHEREKTFDCTMCNKKFKFEGTLAHHKTVCARVDRSDVPSQAAKAGECLVPAKSKSAYEKMYADFRNWRSQHSVNGADANILLAFFEDLSLKYSPNTLWPKLSILRIMLQLKEKINVKMFDQVEAFVKNKNKGYAPKKSKVLSRQQLTFFLREAPNENFLMAKVVLIMEIFGACRTTELVNMLSSDIEDRGSVIVINVLKTKNDVNRKFTIIDEEDLGAASLVREYSALRPPGVSRFFVAYRNKKCSLQPVGKNTFGKIPSKVAEWLGLDNPKAYTGYQGRN